MLNSTGFDSWAGDYDESISKLSEGYPFEGYYEVLSFVNRCVYLSKGTRVLDIGIGTGLLTEELYRQGAEIFGIDFSPKMLELAKRIMPNGVMILETACLWKLEGHQHRIPSASYQLATLLTLQEPAGVKSWRT